jgi:hypothetical protein
MKLSKPKAYDEIKPLRNSTGRPIRCTPSPIAIPEVADRPNCSACQTRSCREGECDWPKE